MDLLEGTGRLPRVLVDIAEATVGGTLSAGGLGTTSHRHGMQIAQVEQLEVVTGTGERYRCFPRRHGRQARERRTFYLFVKGEGGLRAGAR